MQEKSNSCKIVLKHKISLADNLDKSLRISDQKLARVINVLEKMRHFLY
jgi:mevalonate kinase